MCEKNVKAKLPGQAGPGHDGKLSAKPYGAAVHSAPIRYCANNIVISICICKFTRLCIHRAVIVKSAAPLARPQGAPARAVAFAFAWGVSTASEVGSQRLPMDFEIQWAHLRSVTKL